MAGSPAELILHHEVYQRAVGWPNLIANHSLHSDCRLGLVKELTISVHPGLEAFAQPARPAMVPVRPVDRATTKHWR